MNIFQVTLALLFGLAYSFVSACRSHEADSSAANPMAGQQLLTSIGEYAFNLAAFYDGRRNLVRIYSEIEPKYVRPIGTREFNLVHVNQCFFQGLNGTWSTATSEVNIQWAYGDEDHIRAINKVAAYIVECQVPGVDFTLGAPQLSNGIILGEPISIEIIETERQGRLAACSQPLFTKTRGIRDWVNYHFHMGVEKFHMHVPVGPHIDALFQPESREKRIKETEDLNERSPDSVGNERMEKFEHSSLVWQEYFGAPTANYYSETPLFNACLYRFRYAYDYVMLYDCDEWFTFRRQESVHQGAESIPEFLDKHLPYHIASLQLDAFAFPAQCAISDRGDYHSRFTLRSARIWKNMQKLIVRPLAVACTAIHGIADITEQFKGEHPDRENVRSKAEKYRQLPTEMAYIKHIRWFGPPNGSAVPCKFGAAASAWDPEHSLVVQDDSQGRHGERNTFKIIG